MTEQETVKVYELAKELGIDPISLAGQAQRLEHPGEESHERSSRRGCRAGSDVSEESH